MRRNVSELTEREQQVLELLKKGYSQGQIAAELQVEVGTIYQYTWIMRQKLEVPSTYGLIVWAFGLIADEVATDLQCRRHTG